MNTENETIKYQFEGLLKFLKDEGIIIDWYYNGEYHYHIDNSLKQNIEILKTKIQALESGSNVCWQGDMDATIAQNLELKKQVRSLQKENKSLKNRIQRIGNIITRLNEPTFEG